MITKTYEFVCDNCGACETGDINESIESLTARVRNKEKWKSVNGNDYCPECLEVLHLG